MRAVRFEEFGPPTRVLRVEDLPIPEPGPGQVRVRMRARPINPSDISTILGSYGRLPELPATPGFEGSGVIDALGEGVTGLAIGDRVAPFSRSTWQEYVIVDARHLLPIPDTIDDVQAAMLAVNPTSAWVMLEDELKVRPGEWIVQNAGNSALGRYVSRLARRRGYRTISIVRRREVVEELLSDGADHVICEADEDVGDRVREITEGEGAQYGLESVGGESGARVLESLAPGGTMVVFGAISRQPIPVDGAQMIFRGPTIRGFWLTRWSRQATAEQRAELFRTVLSLVEDGTFRAPIAAEYDLGDVVEAVRRAISSDRNGKVVLVG